MTGRTLGELWSRYFRVRYRIAAGGMKALGSVYGYVSRSGLPTALIDLVYLRVSQINGCAYCIDMHSRDLIKGAGGRPDQAATEVEALLAKLPKVEGGTGQLYLKPETARVFASGIEDAGRRTVSRQRRSASPRECSAVLVIEAACLL